MRMQAGYSKLAKIISVLYMATKLDIKNECNFIIVP